MERPSHMWYEWALNLEHEEPFPVVRVGLNLEHGDTFLYVVQVGFEWRAWRDFVICVTSRV